MKKLTVLLAGLLLLAPVALMGIAAAVATDDSPCANCTSTADAEPFRGPDGLVDDPTSDGRITRRMLHIYSQVQAHFHPWPWAIHCWDPHTWNPASDHPRGRACDLTVGRIGHRPNAEQRKLGWQLATWARTNANRLGITYVIWDGHIWSRSRNAAGWRPYNGAGIYNPASITGGHRDHAHISVQ